jgi:hypothetical protein
MLMMKRKTADVIGGEPIAATVYLWCASIEDLGIEE